MPKPPQKRFDNYQQDIATLQRISRAVVTDEDADASWRADTYEILQSAIAKLSERDLHHLRKRPA